MRLSGSFKSYSIALSVIALIVAMASIQIGAVFAKGLFPSRPAWPPPLAE